MGANVILLQCRECYPVYRTLEYSSTSDKTFLSKRSPFSIHFTLLCSDSVKMSWQAFVYFTKIHSAKRLKIYWETSLILPLLKNEPHLENHENASQGRVPSRCISSQHFKHVLKIILYRIHHKVLERYELATHMIEETSKKQIWKALPCTACSNHYSLPFSLQLRKRYFPRHLCSF